MAILNFSRRFKREFVKALSKCGIKSSYINQNGQSLKIPLMQGVGASNHMILDDRMAFFARICAAKKTGLALDVGANVGAFFIQLQSFGWFNKGGSYLGFEPNPLCSYYVQELARINRISDADCLCVALTARPELAILYGYQEADKMASLTADYAYRKHRAKDFTMRVIAEKGDALLERINSPAVSLIKIDVEGHEEDVIAGLSVTLATSTPWLFCEMWDTNSRKIDKDGGDLAARGAMLELLSNIGYVAYDAQMNKHRLIDLSIHAFNALGGTDVIFVPEGETALFESALSHAAQ